MIVGRDRELAMLDQFLDGMSRESAVLVVEGEVGMGKTTLLRAARGAAAARGYTVLSAEPVEAETVMEFAALEDVLSPVAEPVLEALPNPQRRALGVALRREEPAEAAIDPLSIAMAVRAVVRALAESTPVLIAVDDIGWMDASSARALSFVLRRLATEAVGFLGTVRTPLDQYPTPLVTDAVAEEGRRRLVLGPLGLGASRELLNVRTQLSLARPALVRLHEASGGNPYFLLELARAAGGGSEGDELAVPWNLRELVARRLDEIAPSASALLLTCALAADPTLALLAAVKGEREEIEAELRALRDIGLVEVDGGRIAFPHPLVRSVVSAGAEPAAKRKVHADLAAAASLAEERARHLALAAELPDEAIAGEVEAAAASTFLRGSPDGAAVLAQLAVKLTPAREVAARLRRMMRAADYLFAASDAAGARRVAQAVVDELAPGPERADALEKLALFARYAGDPSSAWSSMLARALVDAGDDDSVRLRVLLALGVAASNRGAISEAIDVLAQASDLASAADPTMAAIVAGNVVFSTILVGGGLRSDLIPTALSAPLPDNLAVEERPTVVTAHALWWADELDRAREIYASEYHRLVERGAEAELAIILWPYAMLEVASGDWERAAELVARGVLAADLANSPPGAMFMLVARGFLHAHRGEVDGARADAGTALEQAENLGLGFFAGLACHTLALVDLSLGDFAAAVDRIAPLGEAALAGGLADPGGYPRFCPDEIEALVRLDRRADALVRLELLEQRAAAVGRRSGTVAAARCRGLLLMAEGDLEGAVAAVDEALALQESLPLPFDRARTLLIAGEVHRRAKHKRRARELLETALAAFEHLGARLWAERARAELDRVGLRPPRPAGSAELTEAEQRVADLVASGQTTKEVAAALFMATRTVEAHLSRIYRKLGVRSRTELARLRMDGPK